MVSKLSYYFIPLLFVISVVMFFYGVTINNFSDTDLIVWFKSFVARMEETKIELFEIPEIDVVSIVSFANNGLAITQILRVLVGVLVLINKLIALLNLIINAVAFGLNILKFAFMLILEFQRYVVTLG